MKGSLSIPLAATGKFMKLTALSDSFQSLWQNLPADSQKPADLFYLVVIGFFIGLAASLVVAVFRLITDFAFNFALSWNAANHQTFGSLLLWLILAIAAALIVGRLIRNPAISFGGAEWIKNAAQNGQPRVWRKILLPKFIGSCLVMAFGVSVGREGPSIQMGAATALGLQMIDVKQRLERRFFTLAGSAAGLGAIFSAPFSGICYVYEIMREKFSGSLFIFMLAGSFGVYIGCRQIFGFSAILPLEHTPMPDFWKLWLLIPLAIFAGAVGIAYNCLLRWARNFYATQKVVPRFFQPLFAFGGAALMIIFFPSLSGEGMTIFAPIEAGNALLGYLCIFLVAKLLFTAYCYGSAIPAGVMVPVLCVGGVMGSIYSDWLQLFGLMDKDFGASCIAMGMAGAFAAAERAPVTGLVLVAEVTGAWSVALGMLFTGAIGAFMAKLARLKAV